MLFGGGGFGSGLGGPQDRVSVLSRDSSLSPRPVRTHQKLVICTPEKHLTHWICWLLDRELPASRTQRDKFPLCTSPRLWGFVSSLCRLTQKVRPQTRQQAPTDAWSDRRRDEGTGVWGEREKERVLQLVPWRPVPSAKLRSFSDSEPM